MGACFRSAFVALMALAWAPAHGHVEETVAGPVLVNPAFLRWQGALPEGWHLSIGAMRTADGPLSHIEALPEGGVALVGTPAARRFSLLAQRVVVGGSRWWEARFLARAIDVADGEGTFPNTYVGAVVLDQAGKALAVEVRDVSRSTWTRERIWLPLDAAAHAVELRLFNSRLGRLEVREADLVAREPGDSHDVFVEDMALHYPSFAAHGLDWADLVATHPVERAVAADPVHHAHAILPMLARLADMHVSLQLPDGAVLPTHVEMVDPGFDLAAVRSRLVSERHVPKLFLRGTTQDGVAYLVVGRLPSDDDEAQQLEEGLREGLDAPAYIIDLRVNVGGDERTAQRIVRLLADEERVYARTFMRHGPAPSDLVERTPRRIGPPPGHVYKKPIAVLIGPGCVSSGEGMALMLRAQPHAMLFGRPTRGASGNPERVRLPNGLIVSRTRWRTQLPSGGELERHGVPPDVYVPAHAEGDATYERARVWLREQVDPARDAGK